MLRKLGIVTMFLVLTVVFSIPSAFGQVQPIKMKYSLFWPAPHACTKTATLWAQEIEKTDQRPD